jgi:hypothetical protein
MEKHIIQWSYWLGMASAVVALVMRAFNAFGIWLPQAMAQGRTVWYMSFYKGALLFFVIAIATANNMWSRRQQQ